MGDWLPKTGIPVRFSPIGKAPFPDGVAAAFSPNGLELSELSGPSYFGQTRAPVSAAPERSGGLLPSPYRVE